MATKSMLRALAVLFFCGCHVYVADSKSGLGSTTPAPSAPTCPYRTVNYITHTLRPQCRTSSWAGPANSTAVEEKTSFRSDPTALQTAAHDASSTLAASTPRVNASSSIQPSNTSLTHSTQPSASEGVKTSKPSTAVVPDDGPDLESPLANAHFLSFAEWKKQNLARSGQSEHVGKPPQDGHGEARRKLSPVDTTFDSLGDDAEIDLDFSGFAAEKPQIAMLSQQSKREPSDSKADEEQLISPPKARPRSKDAGTTRKGRYNYASFDCAATILKANPQASGSTAILIENKDSYMLNECSATNKFLILELCGDILIDTVVLANYEFFSSIFRTFRLSVSDRYPVKVDKWKTLGTFEARNTRDVQAFLIENPLIWARYLRIEFLTHYGNEYFCPVSLVRVHGTTMMEDYKHDAESNKSDDEDEEENGESGEIDESGTLEAVAEVLVKEEDASKQAPTAEPAKSSLEPTAILPESSSRSAEPIPKTKAVEQDNEICPFDRNLVERQQISRLFSKWNGTCAIEAEHETKAVIKSDPTKSTDHDKISRSPSITKKALTQNEGATFPTQLSKPSSSMQNTAPLSSDSSLVLQPASSNATKPSSSTSVRPTPAKGGNSTQADGLKTGASSTQPQPANPTIQESFFKSVQKRLQMLETNSSLSLQYIEAQSRVLHDAFSKVEQRQLDKTSNFLNYLNTTVLNELRDFRQQYDQLWQSTVIELEAQREQYQKEVLAINARLGILADEVVFQKRVSILQSILVVVCLCIVLFSRGAMNNYLELPIVQSMLARSPGARMINSPTANTPGGSPSPTRSNSTGKPNLAYGILKRHSGRNSDESRDEGVSPAISYSPPTPTSYDGDSGAEDPREKLRAGSPVASLSPTQRSRSSPPTLPGANDQTAPSPLSWQDEGILEPHVPNEVETEAGSEDVPRLSMGE